MFGITQKQKYLISYVCLDKQDKYIHSGKIKVSSKSNDVDEQQHFGEIQAKISLEKMLQNKYINFGRLIIIDCIKDTGLGIPDIEDLLGHLRRKR